ncbi:MAG: hypothetical protein Q9166_005453, partial [cf. Caloplaca sp. 2 TL-2023]
YTIPGHARVCGTYHNFADYYAATWAKINLGLKDPGYKLIVPGGIDGVLTAEDGWAVVIMETVDTYTKSGVPYEQNYSWHLKFNEDKKVIEARAYLDLGYLENISASMHLGLRRSQRWTKVTSESIAEEWLDFERDVLGQRPLISGSVGEVRAAYQTTSEMLKTQLPEIEDYNVVDIQVDFRLAPEHPVPAQVSDCVDANNWCYNNSSKISGDTTRFLYIGSSLGGGVAPAVSLRLADENKSHWVEGIVALAPALLHPSNVPVDLKKLYKAYDELWVGAPLQDGDIPNRLDFYTGLPHYFWIIPALRSSEIFHANVAEGLKWIVGLPNIKTKRRPSSIYLLRLVNMSTLEDLDDIEREGKEEKQDGDDKDKKSNQDGDAEMKDADGEKKEEAKEKEEDIIDAEILHSSTRDIQMRKRLLDNDMRIMKSEFQRLSHEQSAMKEKIKDNLEKIENNRQLPYLVGNVVELLDLDVEKEAAEEGANIDLDATRVGKSAVIKTSTRQTIFLPLIGLVDHTTLKPGDLIGVNKDSYLVLDTLPAEYDSRVKAMEVDEKPTEKYTDVGGLDKQIEELVEAVVWPMKEAERFKKIGIKAPKGALMYGPPGTGKTLLARACAAQTDATFLKLAGPQLVQMFIGDGAKLVRDCFALAKEKAPSIIFIDELDAVGTKRFDSEKSGDREVQRTMLELLNQLDGFASDDRVKVLAATNRVDVLDPALLRSGRLDRKIEFPLPNEEARAQILKIHSRKMTVDEGVNWPELSRSTDEFGGAQLKAVCVEAGMIALRKGMVKIGHEHYVDAIAEVQSKKKETVNFYA